MTAQTIDEWRLREEFVGGAIREVTLAEFQEALANSHASFQAKKDEFLAERQATDQIYFYSTNPESWRKTMGLEGYLLVRQNQIIASLLTKMN